jgi:hypothetical protein
MASVASDECRTIHHLSPFVQYVFGHWNQSYRLLSHAVESMYPYSS